MMIGVILIFGFFSDVQGNAVITMCPVDWQDLDNITANLGLQVTCGDTYIDVVISNPCILMEEGFDITTDITINGLSDVSEECNELIEIPHDNDVKIPSNSVCWSKRLPQPFNNCGTSSESDGDTIIYRNAVAVYKFSNLRNHTIWRNKLIYLNFECNYTIKYHDVSLDNLPGSSGIDVVQVPHNASAVRGDGQYNYTIRGCLDMGCDSVIIPGVTQIKICYPIYIIIWTSRRVKIFIHDVVAYDRADGSGESHQIVDSNGCVVDNEGPFATEVNSTSYGIAIICIPAFQWANNLEADLYFHVTFEFCDSDAGQDCTLPCTTEPITEPPITTPAPNPTTKDTWSSWSSWSSWLRFEPRPARAIGSRGRRDLPYHSNQGYESNQGLDSNQGATTAILGPWKVV